ncbi:MAG: hypothetical protein ABI718_15705 [Acidobacteriota bacterium]
MAMFVVSVAVNGIGFCRSLPCCPTTQTANASVHRPDCCNTDSCEPASAAVDQNTTAKQVLLTSLSISSIPSTAAPVSPVVPRPAASRDESPPLSPPALQRRMARLSTFLV